MTDDEVRARCEAPCGCYFGPYGEDPVRWNPKCTKHTKGPGDLGPPTARDAIAAECDAIKAMLLAKNDAYGNSALEPVRVFSSASAEEQIRVRIDDKLSRIVRGHAAGEDAVLDLIGYLVLLRVATRTT